MMTGLIHPPYGVLHSPIGGLRYQLGAYSRRCINLFGSALIGYWKLDETSGTMILDSSPQGNHGTSAGLALANMALPAQIGGKAAYFDGSGGYASVFSAGLDADFNGAEGTLMAWFQATAAEWGETTLRRLLYFGEDADNRVTFQRSAANKVDVVYEADNTTEARVPDELNTANWYHLAITWCKLNDRIRVYRAGAQFGTDSTGLGTYSGGLTWAMIGATNTSPGNPFKGHIGHVMLLNREASDEEVAKVANYFQ